MSQKNIFKTKKKRVTEDIALENKKEIKEFDYKLLTEEQQKVNLNMKKDYVFE